MSSKDTDHCTYLAHRLPIVEKEESEALSLGKLWVNFLETLIDCQL